MSVNLSIKGVADDVAERLRRRAEVNHRSLQGELMAIIERAASEPGPGDAHGGVWPVSARAAVPAPGALVGERRGSKTIEQLVAERRGRFPQPIAGGPLAVDILRADRDAR